MRSITPVGHRSPGSRSEGSPSEGVPSLRSRIDVMGPARGGPIFLIATIAIALGVTLGASASAATEEAAPVTTERIALVRGVLADDDLAQARRMHDAAVAAGAEAAQAAGHHSHVAAVSTSLMGGSERSFVAVDRWGAVDGFEASYADPAIGDAFDLLFADEPSVEFFERRTDWHSWGDLPDPTAGEDRWIVVVRGRLADTDEVAARQAHDAVASAAQADAMGAGDIAHVPYARLDDATEFLALDVWDDDANIEAVYGDPAFQAAFAPLFEEPPNLVVYRSTDWYQW